MGQNQLVFSVKDVDAATHVPHGLRIAESAEGVASVLSVNCSGGGTSEWLHGSVSIGCA